MFDVSDATKERAIAKVKEVVHEANILKKDVDEAHLDKTVRHAIDEAIKIVKASFSFF